MKSRRSNGFEETKKVGWIMDGKKIKVGIIGATGYAGQEGCGSGDLP